MSEGRQSLRDCRLFTDLSDEQIDIIAQAFHLEEYGEGEAIFRQGDLGSRIYVIIQGQVGL